MSVVDEIKQRLDIVQVISATTPLKKSGRNFTACCPFHQEKTPSFVVFPDTQGWHCFGSCATGGDVFTFVQRRDGMEFVEALKTLADQAGVRLPDRERVGDQVDSDSSRLREALTAASDWYRRLLHEADSAAAARAYLDGRGLTAATQEAFGLGYSPDGWDHLTRALRDRGYSEDELVTAGLSITSEHGLRDRFRGRVMFPLRDPRGRVLGFGARSLDGAPPKYLNSAQSHLFDKGGMLYGLDLAREAIRTEKRAVIVEGYVDAIMAHQAGHRNVVASMGTALTERQVRLLKGLANQIVLALDADAAGQEATLRGVGVMTEAVERKTVTVAAPQDTSGGLRVLISYEQALDTEIRVAVLTGGKDPDEIIRQDPEAWPRFIEASLPVLDYVMIAAAAGLNLSDARQKARATERVLPFLLEVRDPISRAHYVQRWARQVGVDDRAVLTRLAEASSGRPRRNRPAAEDAAPAALPVQESPDLLGEHVLSLLLQLPECAEGADTLVHDHLESHQGQAVLEAWRAAGNLASLWDTLDPSLHEFVSALLSRPLPPASEGQRRSEWCECLRRLEVRRLKRLKNRQRQLLNEPGVDPTEVARLSYRLYQGAVTDDDAAGLDAFSQAQAERQGLEIARSLSKLHHQRDDAPSRLPGWEGDRDDGRAN
ncbi:MAG: DNA primase [Chloroflexi bacterium]|nr:DNA primase [Chloroflexota bacterium]